MLIILSGVAPSGSLALSAQEVNFNGASSETRTVTIEGGVGPYTAVSSDATIASPAESRHGVALLVVGRNLRWLGFVYTRFFTDCYVLGVDKGPCGAIYNGTNQTQTIASGWFPASLPMSTFKHYVGWTGGQLASVTISGTTYSFNCTGTHCDGSAPDFTTYAFPGVPFGGTTSNVIPAGDAALLVGW